MKPPITLITQDKGGEQKPPVVEKNLTDDHIEEINHAFLSVHSDVGVALTLLQNLQRDTEHLQEIYNQAEALNAIINRIGYLNTHIAHIVSPDVLDKPDAEMWMPILGLTRGES